MLPTRLDLCDDFCEDSGPPARLRTLSRLQSRSTSFGLPLRNSSRRERRDTEAAAVVFLWSPVPWIGQNKACVSPSNWWFALVAWWFRGVNPIYPLQDSKPAIQTSNQGPDRSLFLFHCHASGCVLMLLNLRTCIRFATTLALDHVLLVCLSGS